MNERPVILLVDDDPITLDLVADLLMPESEYHVITATDLGLAQRMAAQYVPSLIVIDLFIGDENGFDLVRWVRQQASFGDAMVIMLTGAAETQTKLKGYEAGVDDYLVKPFSPPEFLSRIRALMRIKRMQDQLKADRTQLERLNAALGEHLDAVTSLLVNIVSLRVPNAALRSQRAAAFTRWVGERLELAAEELHVVALGATLHEVGKVVIGDDVLRKNREAWTEDDRNTIGQFPLFGHMIVGTIPELRDVGRILRHQAENFDGTGSPDHLLREQIPLGARILRIVNCMEEVGADAGRIGETLQAGRGTMFEPRLVQLAIEYLQAVADTAWMEGKEEVPVQLLAEGMVLAADLVTSGGLKLLPSGTTLTQGMIQRIISRHAVDPIITRAYVLQSA